MRHRLPGVLVVKKFKRFLAISLILVFISGVVLLFSFTKYLKPRIISISQSFAENAVSTIIDEEVKKLMLEEFLSYDKITIITRDASGRVTSVSANSVLINNFANDLDIKIGNRIDRKNLIENKVYLSSLIGSELFSGMGPKVPVRFQPVSVTHADITHSFEAAGINQTIHTITLLISVDIEILLPFAHSFLSVVSETPIAQTLIVGTVPQAYFNKN